MTMNNSICILMKALLIIGIMKIGCDDMVAKKENNGELSEYVNIGTIISIVI